jgi:hypothetical protein
VRHAFRYRVSFLYLDSAEREAVFAASRLFSDPGLLSDDAVRDRVRAVTGSAADGPIRVLTTPRYLGYAFNPISLYFCLGRDGVEPPTIVAEVTNTPWNEQHCYVLPGERAERDGASLRFRDTKALHVSPFMPMSCVYHWRIEPPGERLSVEIANETAGQRVFEAGLELERRDLTPRALRRMFWRRPLGALGTIAAIHWQALRLVLRGARFHPHPEGAKS